MLAYGQAELDPGVLLQGLGVPELVLDHWWSGPVSDAVVCGVPGVPKLVGMAEAQSIPSPGWAYWVIVVCLCMMSASC